MACFDRGTDFSVKMTRCRQCAREGVGPDTPTDPAIPDSGTALGVGSSSGPQRGILIEPVSIRKLGTFWPEGD